MTAPAPLSSGVDALIARLREEGVAAGRAEADRILSRARDEAARILAEANAEARQRIDSARTEAEAHAKAGEAALQAAMRDSVLEMKTTLLDRFSADVRRLVSTALHDEDLLRRMILEIAGRARDSGALDERDDLEIVLPESVIELDELRGDPDELQSGAATGLVLGLTGEILREGVSFSRADDMTAGLRIHTKDGDITLDLSDGAVAAMLLKHLQPRFRAILDGIVR